MPCSVLANGQRGSRPSVGSVGHPHAGYSAEFAPRWLHLCVCSNTTTGMLLQHIKLNRLGHSTRDCSMDAGAAQSRDRGSRAGPTQLTPPDTQLADCRAACLVQISRGCLAGSMVGNGPACRKTQRPRHLSPCAGSGHHASSRLHRFLQAVRSSHPLSCPHTGQQQCSSRCRPP